MAFVFRYLSLVTALTVIRTLEATTNTGTETFGECPCNGQPEGVVIPHPTDCRAYYTCLGGLNTLQSNCEDENEFFHPYIRACTQRSAIASFAPDFIPTKDICKITAVFPSPAMEDFTTCIIKYDKSVSNDSTSDELLSKSLKNLGSNDANNNTSGSGLKNIFNMFSSWNTSAKLDQAARSFQTAIPIPFLMNNQSVSQPTTTTTPVPPAVESCKLSSVIIQHFPGPCRANVTCENGLNFVIENCKSSLNLI